MILAFVELGIAEIFDTSVDSLIGIALVFKPPWLLFFIVPVED
jgi:hypothetical protein